MAITIINLILPACEYLLLIIRTNFYTFSYCDINGDTLEDALTLGPSSSQYTKLISYLTKQLCGFYDVQENVNPISGM